MKTLITGHRLFKLENYSVEWIKESIFLCVEEYVSFGLSGMASGVDLWFCEACHLSNIPYNVYIPFQEQSFEMDIEERKLREYYINNSSAIFHVRNSVMLEKADFGIVVWDGNKGGTHNVFQQLVENKKNFIWLNPVNQKLYEIF